MCFFFCWELLLVFGAGLAFDEGVVLFEDSEDLASSFFSFLVDSFFASELEPLEESDEEPELDEAFRVPVVSVEDLRETLPLSSFSSSEDEESEDESLESLE